MAQKSFAVPLGNTRNVTVLAHVDHGKTSFVDSLLSSNNIISARLAGKIRYLDSREDEQERGITMESSAVSLQFQMLRRAKEGQVPPAPEHILNLIDTPGHVDFASEVSTASRLCDGALVLVDVVEGVCTQTIAVLRQAWLDNLKPLLIINKMDRLITELRLTPTEAYHHLAQLIEQVNAVMGSFYASDRMEDDLRWREEREARLAARGQRDDDEAERMDEVSTPGASGTATPAQEIEDEYEEKEDEDLYFAPERGNVIFASAIDGWAFRLGQFARLYAAKLGIREARLRSVLWGDWYLDPKSKRVLRRKKAMAGGRALKPMFVQFVLENIWRVYETVLEEHNPDKVAKIVAALNVKISPRDLRSKDTRNLLTLIFQQWLPLSTCAFQAVVDVIPSPGDAQPVRLPRMLHPTVYASPATGLVVPTSKIETDLYSCAQDAASTVVAYVSKIFAVPRSELPDFRTKAITAEEMRQRGREARERRLAAEAAAGDEAPVDGEIKELPLLDGAPAAATRPDDEPVGGTSEAQSGEALIGFARIYAGSIRKGARIYCVGPKYNADLPPSHAANAKHISSAEISNLYMMMGRELVPVDVVPAGNIFAVAGLEGKVLRNATLCAPSAEGVSGNEIDDDKECLINLAGVTVQIAPIVRVALEPENPADLPKLVDGLRLLNQADPCVEVLVQETGEHVILTAGELHLERCLKDLRERFAKCPISASEAIVPFRETAVKAPDMVSSKGVDGVRGRFSGASVFSLVTFTVRAVLLPPSVIEFLQKNAGTLQTLLADRQVQDVESAEVGASDAAAKATRPDEFWLALVKVLEAAGPEWRAVADNIWAFGPRQIGPNLLIDRTGSVTRGLRARLQVIEDAQAAGKTAAEVVEIVQDMEQMQMKGLAADSDLAGNEKDAVRLLRDFDASIETGFQIACNHGPLCGEPVVGMAYILEAVNVNRVEGDEDSVRSRLPQVTGSLITAVRDACRNGLLDWSPRLMLAMYTCDIQASTDVLGKLYGVVARRRGKIIAEEMKEGTSFFQVTAKVPVIESFGFADEIRKRTSGAASPQLVFSGFEMLDQDPFWVPTTIEELEDLGEKADKANVAKAYSDAVRRRKGMFVEQKVVEHAEKQRTLKK